MISSPGRDITISGRRVIVLFCALMALSPLLAVGPADAASTCFGKRGTVKKPARKDSHYEYWDGTPKADVFALSDYLPPGGRQIWVNGGGGNDLICASTRRGFAVLRGEEGDDRITGGGKESLVLGDEGNDRLVGGRYDDYLLGGDGDDTLIGRGGNDDLSGDGHKNNPNDVEFQAGAGNDRIVGGPGNDVAEGGSGDDVIDHGTGKGSVEGGAGNDVIQATSAERATLSGDSGNDVISDGDGNSNIDGGPGSDEITAAGGNDRIGAGDGTDLINGGGGDDFIEADEDQLGDEIFGGPGDDYVRAAGDDARVYGEDGDDAISGGGDNGLIDGGSGYDELESAGTCVNGERYQFCESAQGGDWIDLRTWIDETDDPDRPIPYWDFLDTVPAGNEVRAGRFGAGRVSLLVGPTSYESVTVQGYTELERSSYAGAVLGYSAPSGGANSPCTSGPCHMDFVLLDWGTGDDGTSAINLVRVNGTFDLDDAATTQTFLMHQESASFDVIATEPGDSGLNGGFDRFNISYSPSRIVVTTYSPLLQETKTLLDVTGTFPPGRVGLYHIGSTGEFAGIAVGSTP